MFALKRFGLCWVALLGCVLIPGSARAETEVGQEGRFHLSLAAHGALVDMEEGWGGGVDLDFRSVWHPVPELGLGIRLGGLFPLRAGSDPRETRMALRVVPGVWLRFGAPEAWAYINLGLGWDGHVRQEGLTNALVLGALAGYAVAPRTLPFFFGFEIAGELNLAGDEVRALGLGGFIGWRL